MDMFKDLVMYWKRGIVLYLASLVITYLIGVIFGIGTEIWASLSRTTTIAGIASILVSWAVAPVINGWIISMVVDKIKK